MDPGSDSDLSDYEQDISKRVETAFDISNVDPAILDRGIWNGERAGARLGSQNGNDKSNIAETDNAQNNNPMEGDWNELQPGTTIPRQWSITPDAAAIAKKLAKEEAIRQKKGLEKKHGKNAHFLDDIVDDRRKPGIPEHLRKVHVTNNQDNIYDTRCLIPLSLSFSEPQTCKHTHAHTGKQIHLRIWKHTKAQIHACTQTQTCTYV